MQTYEFHSGTTPLLISIPHAGTYVPPDIKSHMTEAALLLPDTDRHVKTLYDFTQEMGANILVATHSRYVIDLNRSSKNENLYPEQVKTGLIPQKTFTGDDIYLTDIDLNPTERVEKYWRPYHAALIKELALLKQKFGYAILYDAHSIASQVPRLFEGTLADLNLGTVNGKTCASEIERIISRKLTSQNDFTAVINERFIGGYITRNYGQPKNNIHALQMELAQKNYMDETHPYAYQPERAKELQVILKDVIEALLNSKNLDIDR